MADDMSDSDIVPRLPAVLHGSPGQPTKFTPETRTNVLAGIKAGLSLNGAAKKAGISYAALHKWLLQADVDGADPEFVTFFHDVQQALGQSEQNLVSAIQDWHDRDWRSSAWQLERRFPEDWGKQDTLKIKHSQESSVNVNVQVSISTASSEAMARLQGMMTALLPEPSIDGEFSEVDDTGD